MGGAARFLDELAPISSAPGAMMWRSLARGGRSGPGWLLRRELIGRARGRRVALNNIGFVTPGGQRWTLLRNALHFLTKGEQERLGPAGGPKPGARRQWCTWPPVVRT